MAGPAKFATSEFMDFLDNSVVVVVCCIENFVRQF
jgi:hypothetical protein